MKMAMKIWLTQRLSAVVLAVYSLLMPFYVWMHAPLDAQEWQQLFNPMPVRLATFGFVLALVVHAWTGVRDILLDYIKSPRLRGFLNAGAVLWLLACVIAVVQTLWR